MATTITVLSQKGGTGKTTAVRTLTDVFGRVGLKVLAVDLDPQGNLSDYLDIDPDATPTIGDVLSGSAKIRDADHGGIVPANLGLAEVEMMLGGKMGRELTLRKALQQVTGDYDLVLNIADMRTRHSREAFNSLRQHYGDRLLDTAIRQSIAYAESAERALSILDYRPDLATDYLDVADELLKRLGLRDARRKLKALR